MKGHLGQKKVPNRGILDGRSNWGPLGNEHRVGSQQGLLGFVCLITYNSVDKAMSVKDARKRYRYRGRQTDRDR